MFKKATSAALAAILLSSVTAIAADPVCGDVNNTSSITTADALLVLRKGVGQAVTLDCLAYDNQFSTCEASVADANASLSTCNGNLSTTNADLTTCTGDLATASGGTAAPGDVLVGKTFTSASGVGVAGTVPAGTNLGAEGILGGIIPAGLYNGATTILLTDADLVAGNVKNGVNIFGVVGTLADATCGNGLIDDGEACDLENLNSQDCSQQTGTAKPYGTLYCAVGCEGFDISGCKASRFERHYTNGDVTAVDNQTGLEWVVTDDDGGLTDRGNTYSWSTGDNSFNGTVKTVYLDGLNDVAGSGANCFGGHCDWRLPSVADDGDAAELETMLLGVYPSCAFTPCIDQSVFGPTYGTRYWSSSTNQSKPASAWVVNFYDGQTGIDYTKQSGLVARAVRKDRFVPSSVGGDATVFDIQTGLEWVVTDDDGGLTDKDNTYTWSTGNNSFNGTAKTVYIDGLNAANYGGHNDWRLPSLANNGDEGELETILFAPYVCGTSPCIDQSVFGPTQSSNYWSSSTFQSNAAFAWVLSFSNGGTNSLFKSVGNNVRAVRGGE